MMATVEVHDVTVPIVPIVPPEPIMKYFGYAHLPPALRAVSQTFGELAQYLVDALPRSAERTVALRKLLESKDAAVRAALP